MMVFPEYFRLLLTAILLGNKPRVKDLFNAFFKQSAENCLKSKSIHLDCPSPVLKTPVPLTVAGKSSCLCEPSSLFLYVVITPDISELVIKSICFCICRHPCATVFFKVFIVWFQVSPISLVLCMSFFLFLRAFTSLIL